MKRIGVTSLLLAIAFFYTGCSKPLPPQYLGYQNFRLAKASFGNNILAADVKVYNPNRYSLQVKSASVDVYLNNAYLGHSAVDTLIVLPGKDTTYVPLQLQAKASDVLGIATKVLLNPDVKVKITGSVKAGRSGFFRTVPVDYEGTQHFDLKDFRQ